MNATEGEVQAAIDRLRPLSLVIESSGSRVMRYSQNVQRVLKVPTEAVALLAALWLRGPQTAAELRAASERLHRFADVSSVEGYLEQLAQRASGGGPLVVLSGCAGRRRRQNCARRASDCTGLLTSVPLRAISSNSRNVPLTPAGRWSCYCRAVRACASSAGLSCFRDRWSSRVHLPLRRSRVVRARLISTRCGPKSRAWPPRSPPCARGSRRSNAARRRTSTEVGRWRPLRQALLRLLTLTL